MTHDFVFHSVPGFGQKACPEEGLFSQSTELPSFKIKGVSSQEVSLALSIGMEWGGGGLAAVFHAVDLGSSLLKIDV